MLTILNWGVDKLTAPLPDRAQSSSKEAFQYVRNLKARLNNSNQDYILFEGHALSPLREDFAYRELGEDEVIEFRHTELWPSLIEEERGVLKNGNFILHSKIKPKA